MYVPRLLCATTLLVASLGAVEVIEAAESLPETQLITDEALEGLPLTAPLVVSEEKLIDEEATEAAPMIPEPAGIALIGGGLLAMVVLRRRFG